MKQFLLLLLLFGCSQNSGNQQNFYAKLSDAALSIVNRNIRYDADYTQIPYPNGDVAKDRGVCTDVVIRSYRKLGIDLQKEVHEDMAANFSKYPKSWGLRTTDTHIDHRRVPNLEVFFSRKGTSLPVTDKAADYKPGDVVSWRLPSGRPHIGIVVDKKGANGRYKMVHNIGFGQELEDCLFGYKINGHFRYQK
ncbi:MAG: DUF1287 domain-containing protein [Bacteroidia bacterium]